VAVGNMVSLIEVMQSFTPIVAEQAGVRNPAAFPGAQLIRFEDATCAPCHAGSQVDSMEICNCCRRIGEAIARLGLPTVFVQEGGYL